VEQLLDLSGKSDYLDHLCGESRLGSGLAIIRPPLLVFIQNNSTRIIDRTQFVISIRRKGYSSKINGRGNHDTDRIIKPSEGFSMCVPYLLKDGQYDNPEDFLFDIDSYNVTFRR
jgi:hypothetical protein